MNERDFERERRSSSAMSAEHPSEDTRVSSEHRSEDHGGRSEQSSE